MFFYITESTKRPESTAGTAASGRVVYYLEEISGCRICGFIRESCTVCLADFEADVNFEDLWYTGRLPLLFIVL